MDTRSDASALPADDAAGGPPSSDRDQRFFALLTLLVCGVAWWWWPGFAAGFADTAAQVEGGATSGERFALGPGLARGAALAAGLVALVQLLPWRRLRWVVTLGAAVVVLGALLWGWDTLATLAVRHMQAQAEVEASQAPAPGG